jgi:hypothetical protein
MPVDTVTSTPSDPTPTATLATPTAAGLEERIIGGLKPDIPSNRIAEDDQGLFTRMRSAPDATSEPIGLLRNGDRVALLSIEVHGWYRVRILTSSDPLWRNVEGWIERWLVGDEPPPTATPRPTRTPATRGPAPNGLRVFVVSLARSNPPSPDSQKRESCVTGQVVDRSGKGIDNALLYVNNGVSSSEMFATVKGGYYQKCGLGGGRPWTVVLTYIPGPGRIAHEAKAVINVDGSPSQGGVVNFRER